MKAYAINSKYGNRVRIIELEVEEKEKTYRVIESGIGFNGSIIRKQDVDIFFDNDEQIVCFDLEKGLEIYEDGINKLIDKEIERHFKSKNRFLLLKSQLEIGIE